MMKETHEDRALNTVCLSVSDGDGLREVLLVPWGRVKSRRGEFLLDDEGAREIVKGFIEHGVALPIDFEHESLSAEGRSNACGWVERLWIAPGIGLKALVRWGDDAKKAIRADQYRYLSPVLLIHEEDRRAVGLHSVALTNVPAIPGMEKLAASTRIPQETELLTMADGQNEALDLVGKLRALLELSEDTSTIDTLKAAIDKLSALLGEEDEGENEAVASSVRELLELPADAGKAAVVLALKTRDAGGASEELVEMRKEEAERAAQEHVGRFVKEMKINENDATAMSAALQLARERPDQLDAIMANAASVMPPQGRTSAPDPAEVSRLQTIQASAREYRGNPAAQKTTSMLAFVNLALRERKLALLSEGEAREYVTV